MRRQAAIRSRRAFTVRDLAVVLSSLLIAVSLLVSLTGATRNLSQTQTCASHLRQLFLGLTSYVTQYNTYPPHAPYPAYALNETVNGLATGGWDPSIGWILTHGMGYAPPATFPDGHFKWYGVSYDSLPDVCKCPSLPPALFDPTNPELANPAYGGQTPLESQVYQYALSYQTSGTCRSACPIIRQPTPGSPGIGGRNPAIPDPTSLMRAHQYDNAQRGIPYVWVFAKMPGLAPDDPTITPGQNGELNCWIQAVGPSEVDQPGRVYYLADSRDYRPTPEGQGMNRGVPAGFHNGWIPSWGNKTFVGTRHFGYANVMYLDGRVTRDGQMHDVQWNMDYDAATGQGLSTQWRAAASVTNIRLANIRGQAWVMPQLNVAGWEAFFDANGLKAR